jgi:hypothetical protein
MTDHSLEVVVVGFAAFVLGCSTMLAVNAFMGWI